MEGSDRAAPVARCLQDVAQRVAREGLRVCRRLAGILLPVGIPDRLVGRCIDAERAHRVVAAGAGYWLAAVDDDEAEAQHGPVAVLDHGDTGREGLLPMEGDMGGP